MATTFAKCGTAEYALLDELISTHRPDLKRCEARITLLFAHSDTPGRPALKHQGRRVAGRVQVNSLQDRIEGKGDATITLDAEWWEGKTRRRRLALIHHELSHLAGPRQGAVNTTDALGRPKLRLIHADWNTYGFDLMIRLYGGDAQEAGNLRAIGERLGQEVFPFVADGADRGDGADSAEVPGGPPPPGPPRTVALTPEHLRRVARTLNVPPDAA